MPSVDIEENNDEFILKADFPGFDKKNIELSIDNGVLNLSAKQNSEYSESNKFTIKERNDSSFQRSFRVPDSVDQDKIKANYKNGILKIKLPKRKESISKPNRVINIG